MGRKSFWALVILILAAAPLGAENKDVIIDISRFDSHKINVAVAPFAAWEEIGEDNLGVQIAAIIKNDLNLSGYFTIAEGLDEQKLQSSNLDFSELSRQGVDAVVKGTITRKDDLFILECYLYDTASKVRITGVRYKASQAILRKSVHDFSDEIVFQYTGRKGIAHSKICFVGDLKGQREIYVVDYDGYDLNAVTKEKALVLLPKWTPDGKKIIYTSYKDGNPDLYIINENGSGCKMLSGLQGLNSMARFSPDGKSLAIILSKDGNPELYVLSPAGEIVRRVTNSKSIDSTPSWSPSNRDIVFISDRTGIPQLFVTDSEGVNVRRLIFSNIYTDSPEWSPTGERIVYVSKMQRGEFNIFTTDVSGNYQQQLTSGTKRNENPSWSPDGRFLVLVSNRNGKSQLFVMNNDGSNQRPLFPGELADQFKGEIYTPCWSP
ncbi:MAG: Tol-Pal system beta propeller repeat protein TolB [Elusimicrobia bacterium]|nr:Tol-Pal system beta propeller repeat protein TolB [Elusimicrobiota bacterium]